MAATMDLPMLDGESLRFAGRDLPDSFEILLAGEDRLRVEKVLRLMPGKRLTARACFQNRTVLAKVFFSRSAFQRQMLRETKGLKLLRRRHLPAPLSLGSCPIGGGGGVLLIEYLAPAESVMERWQALPQEEAGSEAQLEVLQPLFLLAGLMHKEGLCQKDLHLGNFLWHEGQLKVVDGGGIAPCRWTWQRLANLGLLAAQLPEDLTRSLPRLLAAYHQGRGKDEITPESLTQAAQKHRHKRLEDYLAKTLRDSSGFCVAKNFRHFSSVVRSSSSWLKDLVEDPDGAMARGKPLKLGGGTTVVQLAVDGHQVVIKRYNRGRFWRHLKRCWRRSRARKSWLNGYRLRGVGIATPRPLALVEERRGLLCDRSWLVTEYVEGENILELMARYEEGGPPAAVREALKTLFENLRRERISHGDMKGTNLIWRDGKFLLIDLDGMRVHRSGLLFAKARNRDRERFLRNWERGSSLNRRLASLFPEMENGQE